MLGTGGLPALWMTFLVGMTPILELRGAIPLGAAAGLPPLTNFLSLIFCIFFFRHIIFWFFVC